MDQIKRYKAAELIDKDDAYCLMFEEIEKGTAALLTHWQSISFNHIIVSTDNMSIASLTIDNGPHAFLDSNNFNHICNHTDRDGRYVFANHSSVANWSLAMLARDIYTAKY